MKKVSFFLFLALFVLFLSGCELKFTALTKINADSSGFRITTYSADEESEKEELLNRYILSEGGTWKIERYTPSWSKVERKNHIYEVKRAFKDLNELTPDYTRRGTHSENLSKSRYELNIKKGLIFNTYEYVEIFTDSANEKEIRKFCEREYNYVLDRTSEYLEASLPEIIAKDKIRIYLNDTFCPYYDYFIREFLKDGFRIFESEDKETNGKLDELRERFSEDGFLLLVQDYLAKEHIILGYLLLDEKLKEVRKKIEEELQAHWEKLTKNNYEDAFGVYGMPIFVSYPFSVTVIMPGRIIDSNSGDIKFSTAKWIFYPSDFFLKEYKLEAKSKRLNYVSAGIAAMGLLIILILSNLKNIRKLKLWK